MTGRLVACSLLQDARFLWRVPKFLLNPVQDLVEPGIMFASVGWTGSGSFTSLARSRTGFSFDMGTSFHALFATVLHARSPMRKLVSEKLSLEIRVAPTSDALALPIAHHDYSGLWEVPTGEPCSPKSCHANLRRTCA